VVPRASFDSLYKDAEAVLHEALQIQAHLQAQNTALEHILVQLGLPVPPIVTSAATEKPATT
jgi:hypothetical protein